MKTIRWIGMAISAVLLSVGLSACSSDDDGDDVEEPVIDEPGVATNVKKLTCLKYYVCSEYFGMEGNESTTYNMKYDAAGKLSSVAGTDIRHNESYPWNSTYTWSNDIIYFDGPYGKKILNLANGLIVESQYETYVYDSNNKIKSMKGDGDWQFVWDGEKLVKVNTAGLYATITYSGKTCNGQCVVWFEGLDMSDFDELTYAHPELFGLRTSELPTKIEVETKNEYDYTLDYQYEFTDDNYVSKIFVTDTRSDGETATSRYELTWE
jgi:hypothetical protein